VAGAVAGAAALAARGVPSSARAGGITRRLYVAINGSMSVYDVPSWRVLRTVSLPTADGPRGIACHAGIGSLWIAHGASGGTGGRLLRYDLATDTVLWNRSLGTGVDQPAVALDGSKLYVPRGEGSSTRAWSILDPRTGDLLGSITGGAGPHNTIARNQHVYLGGVKSNRVYLDNGFSVGPLVGGVRPFTVDASESLVYTTATRTRGFQVSSIMTGKVLATVSFGPTPSALTVNAPSHGISLSPDGGEVWVLDLPAQAVRIYTSGRSPVHVADVPIHPIKGTEQPPTSIEKAKSGWLLHSKVGDYVYVGDSGSVISTATRTEAVWLSPLNNGRHGFVEVMFDAAGAPVDTTTHFGLGY
jgi:hypothetical protein